MGIYRKIYTKILSLAAHPRAIYFLAAISVFESCILPVSPMAVLVPMVLANRKKAWLYISIAALFSVVGSVIGYCLGNFFVNILIDFLQGSDFLSQLLAVQHMIAKWGLWLLLTTIIIPFPPYKIFTISAGILQVKFIPFVLVSLVARYLYFSIFPWVINFSKNFYLSRLNKRVIIKD